MAVNVLTVKHILGTVGVLDKLYSWSQICRTFLFYAGLKQIMICFWIFCETLVPSDFSGSSEGKESACNVGDPGSMPGLGRSPREGNGNPLQYSCLENPMDGGAWQATVHGVANSRTWLSDLAYTQLKQTPTGHSLSCLLMYFSPWLALSCTWRGLLTNLNPQ